VSLRTLKKVSYFGDFLPGKPDAFHQHATLQPLRLRAKYYFCVIKASIALRRLRIDEQRPVPAVCLRQKYFVFWLPKNKIFQVQYM